MAVQIISPIAKSSLRQSLFRPIYKPIFKLPTSYQVCSSNTLLQSRSIHILPSRVPYARLSPFIHSYFYPTRAISQSRSTLENLTPNTPPPKPLLPLENHENIYTIPNILTASRLICAPIIAYCIVHEQHVAAVSLVAYATITDLVDGWIARRFNMQTVVGTVIDPMADKALMLSLTLSLAYANVLPLWLLVIILGRDVLLGISAIYYRYISLPAPKTFTRFWDFSLPSAEVHPTTISKVNTALQFGLMVLLTSHTLLSGFDLGRIIEYYEYLVATTTIWSGLSYIYSKDAVKILHQHK